MTSASPDFVDLMRAFNAHGVECLVVGAHALAAHGFVRATKDLDGLTFSDAWSDRVETRFGGQPTAVLSRRALIANKRATGRLQDLADLERLGGGDH